MVDEVRLSIGPFLGFGLGPGAYGVLIAIPENVQVGVLLLDAPYLVVDLA